MKRFVSVAPRKIIIFRALQIGDWLCALPAIRALKIALPESELTLVGLPWSKTLVDRFPQYFSSFIHFPGYPSFPEQSFQLPLFMNFLSEIQGRHYDAVIQMHGNGTEANSLVTLFNAKRIAGYYIPGKYMPDKHWCMPYPDFGHEIHRHLMLMSYLGIPSQGDDLEFPILPNELEEFNIFAKEHTLEQGKYVCVHPGSRASDRRWSPHNFAFVADRVMERGYKVVITGTDVEEENIRQMQEAMKHRAVVAVNTLSLGAFAVLLSYSKLLLSNDTGASHIAAAVKVPSVVIFLASDPHQWAPLNRALHYVVLPQQAHVEYIMQRVEERL